MSVSVELDGTHNRTLTCLDNVTGKVILNLPAEETISSITVKMEGVARSRLEPIIPEGPPQHKQKKRAEIEIHRVLYLVQTVFPSQALLDAGLDNKGLTLKAGQYEYPFSLRIPINSSCTPGAGVGGGILQKISFEKGNIDYAKDATEHVKGTLPPSLSGVPEDKAWIRYFLKVTVNKTKIYKANLRQHHPFVFLPIEPPRPPPTNAETYARRKHEFLAPSASGHSKLKGFFGSFSGSSSSSHPTHTNIRFSLEARLPAPAIVVPNEPLPLRVLLTKLDDFKETIFLRSLQITLLINTVIRAHDLSTDEADTILLLSVADLYIPIGGADTPRDTPMELDRNLWAGKALPDTVPPSFKTCNISRSYKLQVDLGVSRSGDDHHDIMSLVLPLEVYSGITPPKQLVNRVSMLHPPTAGKARDIEEETRPPLPARHPTTGNDMLKIPARRPVPGRTTSSEYPPEKTGAGGASFPVASGSSSGVGSAGPASPSRENKPELPLRPVSGHYVGVEGEGAHDLPPPTYEDAMAEDIGPVDGPRRQYQQEGGYYQALPEDLGR